MRMLLKVAVPVESGNAAIQDGTFAVTIEQLLEAFSPEAAYFTVENGRRTAFIFLDVADPSAMPQIGEPLFMNLGAEIDLTPAMNAAELRQGLAAVAEANAAAV